VGEESVSINSKTIDGETAHVTLGHPFQFTNHCVNGRGLSRARDPGNIWITIKTWNPEKENQDSQTQPPLPSSTNSKTDLKTLAYSSSRHGNSFGLAATCKTCIPLSHGSFGNFCSCL
jgi:hypothetical protein